jgi:hypothetical protein
MALANPAVAASFSIATLGDWFDIRLPKGETAADELAARLAASWPGEEGAAKEEELRDIVRSLVSAAAALDVLCAYATLVTSNGHWLPASLVINAFPLRGKTVVDVADELSGTGDGLLPRSARLVELPVGQAARVERLREWDAPANGRHPVSLIIQYVVEVPGSEQALVLTFSTPALGLAQQLRPLFHAVASTLRFKGPTGPLPSEPGDYRR